MSILTLEAKLERQDSSTPWGFRMQGGKDFSSPITIARVNPGSLAAKCGLQQGDIILKIGSKSSDTLKHKDAQDAIVSYGNKLDLLLQRIREKKKTQNGFGGGGPTAQSYDTFAAPTISSYGSGGPPTGQQNQVYNAAPKPFNSAPSKPAPYNPGAVDNISKATATINLSQPSYSKYQEVEEPAGQPSHQSRSFKFLQNTLDSGQEPPQSSPNAPWKSEGSAPAPAPAKAPAKAPPAPKPGVWAPGQGAPAAPPAPPAKAFNPSAAPPFTPAAAPPASRPQAPKAPPSKPTGVGAMRGKIGDAVVKTGADAGRVPICHSCGGPIRGPFVTAMGKSWCPDHFICANPRCGNKLMNMGFVEEGGFIYCEKDYELYFAPHCAKCDAAIVGECVNALNKQYHPACFLCFKCKQPIGGTQFHLEDGHPYCENDWRQMYQTMCTSCNFPIEPGDKWVEAMNNNYHSECFNCSTCQVNLEGQAFYAKSGKPYCKKHAS
ncbi:PDZ and LIM domain protein Zasp-like isoform X6 [Mya arenaria]|uniref:PDZ and LIM domain protein Zasp-like isoform X6 n=1 Tax=Mya arenaria TaxID=6604 RepID=UPI0022E6A6D8|nr:PDZ and LIM domain protein Zasp-like isoform X6 [Mya arenaria]